MSVSEGGDWYALSDTERLRRQEAESLRSQNATLTEEVQRLQVQLAEATAARTAVPEGDGAELTAAAATAAAPTGAGAEQAEERPPQGGA